MKSTTVILAAIFALQASVLFAGNESTTASTSETVVIDIARLTPAVPQEAGFEDVVPAVEVDLNLLTPAVPLEADFNDTMIQEPDIRALAPSAPVFADFE